MASPEKFYQPDEKLIQSLSTYLKNYRKEHSLTQVQLAEQCHFHPKFIQTLESKGRNISLSAFVQLAKGLSIEPENLMSELLDGKK